MGHRGRLPRPTTIGRAPAAGMSDEKSKNIGSGSSAVVLAPVLSANVLVLNKFYQAIRVINVRRAFSLLCRDMAEVVHIETDNKGHAQWQNFDFTEWQELSSLKAEFEPDEFDWIHTVRFQIAV